MQTLEERKGRLVPVELDVSLDHLESWERAVLRKLARVCELFDQIFIEQLYDGGNELLGNLGEEEAQFFATNLGPWDRAGHQEPFVADMGQKPDGSAFYPLDMTRQEFEARVGEDPDLAAGLRSNYSVVRRDDSGRLTPIPYREFYGRWLRPASALLAEAADLAQEPTLSAFLAARAEALLSDDYRPSEMLWMDLAGNIEATIGPYEVYEDQLFATKTSYEAFISLRDGPASDSLGVYVDYLGQIDQALPMTPGANFTRKSQDSPISVVNQVAAGGDAKAVIVAMAYNLPNDEAVRQAKGSKKVLLRNVMKAKFDHITLPIATALMDAAQAAELTFDGYLAFVLMHELSHGFGPATIIAEDGQELTVDRALLELHSGLEEAKADACGAFSALWLAEAGVISNELARQVCLAYLAGAFRAVRFGAREAHGQGYMVEFNFLQDRNAIVTTPEGLYALDFAVFPSALNELVMTFLDIQAGGDRERARTLFGDLALVREDLQRGLDRIVDVPIDIEPRFVDLFAGE